MLSQMGRLCTQWQDLRKHEGLQGWLGALVRHEML
jgi:hypothetical protein